MVRLCDLPAPWFPSYKLEIAPCIGYILEIQNIIRIFYHFYVASSSFDFTHKKEKSKRIEFLPQTQILEALYLCNLMV